MDTIVWDLASMCEWGRDDDCLCITTIVLGSDHPYRSRKVLRGELEEMRRGHRKGLLTLACVGVWTRRVTVTLTECTTLSFCRLTTHCV